MLRNRRLAAAAFIFFANFVVAWWVKGDLEMAWLAGGPMILAGGLVFGALAAVFLRRSPRAAGVAFVASCAWAFALAAIAIETPHAWSGAPPRELTRAAGQFAGNPAALRAAAEAVTKYPVEPARAVVRYSPSEIRKIGFSFVIARRPAEAQVSFGFEAGPGCLEPVRARPLPIVLRRRSSSAGSPESRWLSAPCPGRTSSSKRRPHSGSSSG